MDAYLVLKAKQGLVAKKITVKHPKTGKPFQQTVYVRSGEKKVPEGEGLYSNKEWQKQQSESYAKYKNKIKVGDNIQYKDTKYEVRDMSSAGLELAKVGDKNVSLGMTWAKIAQSGGVTRINKKTEPSQPTQPSPKRGDKQSENEPKKEPSEFDKKLKKEDKKLTEKEKSKELEKPEKKSEETKKPSAESENIDRYISSMEHEDLIEQLNAIQGEKKYKVASLTKEEAIKKTKDILEKNPRAYKAVLMYMLISG